MSGFRDAYWDCEDGVFREEDPFEAADKRNRALAREEARADRVRARQWARPKPKVAKAKPAVPGAK